MSVCNGASERAIPRRGRGIDSTAYRLLSVMAA